MRAFVAIDIPSAIKEGIALLSKEIALPGVVPVKPDAMHITLQFLGEISNDTARLAEEAIDSISAARFEIGIEGTSTFSAGSPRIVFAEISKGRNELELLYSKIAGALAARRVKFDKREYVPHVTIARVKSLSSSAQVLSFISKYKNYRFGSFDASEIKLKESVLSSAGPSYTDVYSRRI